nr:Rrf2 family transcriptional regulator [uncultured Catonella sp.]
MKISTKGRYALRLIVDLAEHRENGFIALKDIAKRQNVSKKYLEQIVPLLNGAGLLTTNRGNHGGYKLSKEPAEYTVGEVLRTTEVSMVPVGCLDSDVNHCERYEHCQTLFVWEGLYKTINEFLDSITIQDIIDRECAVSK